MCIPYLRCLHITSGGYSAIPGSLGHFEQLTSLEIPYGDNLIQAMLTSVGHQLKELCIYGNREKDVRFTKVLKIFTVCPNLESLAILDFLGPVERKVPVISQDLKLKKLSLSGNFYQPSGILPLILRAPYLEEVKMSDIMFSKLDVQKLMRYLAIGNMFQSLVNIEISLGPMKHFWYIPSGLYRGSPLAKELRIALESLAKNIVSFSPMLQSTSFYFTTLTTIACYSVHANSSAAPFVDLLNTI